MDGGSMKKHVCWGIGLGSLAAFLAVSSVHAEPRALDDQELDMIGGGATTPIELADDSLDTVSTLAADTMSIMDMSSHSIYVGDQAQQNMTTLVNILAINSQIQVMLNLNVSINSTVGSVSQSNTGTQNGLP